MRLSSVDLPDPDGPITATISPRVIASVTRSRATTLRLPSNCFVTDVSSIAVGAVARIGVGPRAGWEALAMSSNDDVNRSQRVKPSEVHATTAIRRSLHASRHTPYVPPKPCQILAGVSAGP